MRQTGVAFLTFLGVMGTSIGGTYFEADRAIGQIASAGYCQSAYLDFRELETGSILREQLASLGIHIRAAANEGRPNQLIIFNSNATGTPDPEVEAKLGNMAIIPENLSDLDGDRRVDAPNNSIRGGSQFYEFDHLRTVGSFTIVDVDHGSQTSHFAAVFDSSNKLIKQVPVLVGLAGSVQRVEIGAAGVKRLEITYRDSAGVTGIDLGCDPALTLGHIEGAVPLDPTATSQAEVLGARLQPPATGDAGLLPSSQLANAYLGIR
jgi:hypothetical protein